MNKLLALTLCLIMLLSLAACGSNAEPAVSTTDAPSEAATAAPTEAPTQAPTEAGPAFDTSWAGNEFEALLPEPPFTGWKTTQENDQTYEMELGGLNTNMPGFEETSGGTETTDKVILMEYLDSLTGYGFTVEEVGGIEGYPYMWDVYDSDGNYFEFICAEGYCWITITKNA